MPTTGSSSGGTVGDGNSALEFSVQGLEVLEEVEVEAPPRPAGPVPWRAWNEASRVRRLHMHQQHHGKAPIGVVVESGEAGCNLSNSSSSFKKVWIFDGEFHFSALASEVRPVTYSEDRALDQLHRSRYQVGQALAVVRGQSAMGSFREVGHWAPQEVNKFLEAFEW